MHLRNGAWICGRKGPERGVQKPREAWAPGWRQGKKLEHVLTDVQEETRTGVCAKCGPVIVLEGKGRRRRKDSPWTCSRRPPGRVGGAPTTHQISNINEQEKTGICAVCGPIKLVWRSYKNGTGTWGCFRTRFSISNFTAYKYDENFKPAICPFCAKQHRWDRGEGKVCRAKLVEQANNCCAICACEFSETNKPRVDHDHVTGATRGVLCRNCNVALGLFKDDVTRVQAALDYLKR